MIPVKPSTQYTPRREIREWTDFDRLLADKGDVSRATKVSAMLLTLLFHGALILSVPWALGEKKAAALVPVPPPPEFALQPLTPDDMKFVEANPNAPEAPKQDTPNISDRNQAAAQKTPDLTSNADAPQVKGEQTESQKIVSGDTRPNQQAAPPPRPAQRPTPQSQPSPPPTPQQQAPQTPTQQQPPQQQTVQPPVQQPPTPPQPKQPPPQQQQQPNPPLPKPSQQPAEKAPEKPAPVQGPTQPAPPPPTTEKTYIGHPQPIDPNGQGVKLVEKPVDSPSEKPIESKSTTESATEKPNDNKTTLPSTAEQTPPPPPPAEPTPTPTPLATVQATQPVPPQPQTPPTPEVQPSDAQPMARRQVQVHVPAGPLMNNMQGTRNAGETAIQSNFSQFGNYEQRMLEAVSAQWNQLVDKASLSGQDVGTRVVVVFTLDQQGNVVACQVVNATATGPALYLCPTAIQSRSPFGPWTEDMKKVLGETQNVRITFWYR